MHYVPTTAQSSLISDLLTWKDVYVGSKAADAVVIGGIAVDSKTGTIYFTDMYYQNVKKFNAGVITTFNSTVCNPKCILGKPYALALDSFSNMLYIGDAVFSCIQVLNINSNVLTKLPVDISGVAGITFELYSNTLYIAATGGLYQYKISTNVLTSLVSTGRCLHTYHSSPHSSSTCTS